jgi:hypothetical protein
MAVTLSSTEVPIVIFVPGELDEVVEAGWAAAGPVNGGG